ncbi:MAG: hypothetical protein EOO68_35365, partial [Moraxellaceae bacterium]
MRILKNFIPLIFCSVGFSLFIGCSKVSEPAKIEGFAQGTTYHLTFVMSDAKENSVISEEVTAELKRIDASISNYRKDSTIELFNAQLDTEPHEVNEEVVKLVEYARSISKASGGCYDLTIKPLFDLWGFKKDDSERKSVKVAGEFSSFIRYQLNCK